MLCEEKLMTLCSMGVGTIGFRNTRTATSAIIKPCADGCKKRPKRLQAATSNVTLLFWKKPNDKPPRLLLPV